MSSAIKEFFAHPLARGLDINDPSTTDLRRKIISSKPFLRRIYETWYSKIAQMLPDSNGIIVEIGSGAGFMGDYIGGVIRTEVFICSDIDLVMDACALPFKDGNISAVVMTDVLHHIPDVGRFFEQAERCLAAGGRIIMWEPWKTVWSGVIYRYLHHEPFEPDSSTWNFPSHGPLSSANGALPWIVFERDRTQFERQYPTLKIKRLDLAMPFSYLLSGGVSLRSLAPGWSYRIAAFLETLLRPVMRWIAMFAFVVVEKESCPGTTAGKERLE